MSLIRERYPRKLFRNKPRPVLLREDNTWGAATFLLRMENIRVFRLGTGMRVVIEQQHATGMAAFYLRVNAGSIHEGEYLGSGIAHLVEHAMFLGSRALPKKDDFSELIERFGGVDLNAYTTYDHTAYFATVFTRHLHKTLKAVKDFAFAPLFPQEALLEEMGTIRSEMQMSADRASWVFHDYIQMLAYPTLPYACPIIGFKPIFNTLSRRAVKWFHRTYYRPDNMILALKGAINTATTLRYLEKLFATSANEYDPAELAQVFTAKKTYLPKVNVAAKAQTSHSSASSSNLTQPNVFHGSNPTTPRYALATTQARRQAQLAPLSTLRQDNAGVNSLHGVGEIAHPRAQYVQLAYTWRMPMFGESDDVLVNLLGSFLTGGRSTPLYVRLKEQLALVHSIYAYVFMPVKYFAHGHGTFTLYVRQNVAEQKKSLAQQINDLTQELFLVFRQLVASAEKTEAKPLKLGTPRYTRKALERLWLGIQNETSKEMVDEAEHLLESTGNLATSLFSTGSAYYTQYYLEEVKNLQLADMLGAVKRYLLQAPYQLAILMPTSLSSPSVSSHVAPQLPAAVPEKRLGKNPVTKLPARDRASALRETLQYKQQTKMLRSATLLLHSEKKPHLARSFVQKIRKNTSDPQSFNKIAPYHQLRETSPPAPPTIAIQRSQTNLPPAPKPTHAHRPKRVRLSNGVHWMSEAKPLFPKVVIVVRFRGGQAFEGPLALKAMTTAKFAPDPLWQRCIRQVLTETRLAYLPYGTFALLSKLIFSSNAHYTKQKLHEALKLHAIDYETATGASSCTFMLSYLKDKHAIVAELLRSILLRADFTTNDFKQAVKEQHFQRKREQESLGRLSHLGFNSVFYAQTPYAVPIKGTEESIATITLPLVNALRKVFITGHQLAVAVKGDFLATEAAELQAIFNALPSTPASSTLKKERRQQTFMQFFYPKYQFPSLAKGTQAKRFIKIEEPTAQKTYYKLGFRTTQLKSKHTLPLELIKHHFSGMGGALFKLRSANFTSAGKNLGGRAYSLGCYTSAERDFGAFIFYAVLRKEAKEEYTFMRQAFLNELDLIKRKRLTAKQLQAAKDAMEAIFMTHALSFSYETSLETLYTLYNIPYLQWKTQPQRLKAITAADIQATACYFFKEKAYLEHILQGKRA